MGKKFLKYPPRYNEDYVSDVRKYISHIITKNPKLSNPFRN